MDDDPRPDPDRGIYGITVAAELVGSGPQNLRLYEARGLLTPDRSEGGTRRYSDNDLDRLRQIGRLLAAGLNLAGVDMVLDLRAVNEHLRRQLAEAKTDPGSSEGTVPMNRAAGLAPFHTTSTFNAARR